LFHKPTYYFSIIKDPEKNLLSEFFIVKLFTIFLKYSQRIEKRKAVPLWDSFLKFHLNFLLKWRERRDYWITIFLLIVPLSRIAFIV